MAKITDIIVNKKGDRAKFFLDGKLFGSISCDVIFKCNLNIGGFVDEEYLSEIVFQSDKIMAFDYLLNYILKYSATEKAARDKLKDRGYNRQVEDYVIEKAKSYRYLDDLAYAENYVNSKAKSCGTQKLKNALYLKGVESAIISQALLILDKNEELENAINISQKWAKNKDMSDKKNHEKMIRFLQYRGYKWDIIAKCLSNVKANIEEESNDTGEF